MKTINQSKLFPSLAPTRLRPPYYLLLLTVWVGASVYFILFIGSAEARSMCPQNSSQVAQMQKFEHDFGQIGFNLRKELLFVDFRIGAPQSEELAHEALGAEGAKVSNVLIHITIKTGHHSYYVPYSAYADLGDPYEMGIVLTSGSRFTLVINGSDGAGAWTVCWQFDSRRLLGRTVYDSNQRRILEETSYPTERFYVDWQSKRN